MNIIEVKEIEKCKLSVHYETDAEAILNKRAEILNAFKKAPTPGFRPGKSSIDSIKIHYKDQIEDALKRALAEDAFHNTLFEKKIRPHGAPSFNSLMIENGKFTCDFELLTKPDFILAPFKDQEIPKPHQTETVSTISEKIMQDLRVKFGESNPYEESDKVESGDNVIVNYQGSIDGEIIPSLCAEGEMLAIGGSQMFSFDENLIGMKMDEERNFDLTVPEGGLPSLVGKTINFTAKIIMGSKTVPMPLNDDLAKKLNKETYLELKEAVNAQAAANLHNAEKLQLNNAISAKLVADNEIDVPNWMSVSEAKYLAHNSKLDWEKIPDQDKEKFIEMGEKNVKLSLVLDKVRETEPDAQLSDQEVFNIIKQNLAKTKTQTSLDDVIKEMQRTGYLQILFSRIKDEFALDFITKSVKVVE